MRFLCSFIILASGDRTGTRVLEETFLQPGTATQIAQALDLRPEQKNQIAKTWGELQQKNQIAKTWGELQTSEWLWYMVIQPCIDIARLLWTANPFQLLAFFMFCYILGRIL